MSAPIAEKDASEHTHYWFPVPAYRSKNGETNACRCGATYSPGIGVTPPGEVTA